MMVYDAVTAELANAEGGVLDPAAVKAMLTTVTTGNDVTGSAEAENAEAADDERGMLSDIIQGWAIDPWFANANNVADLELWYGLYYNALVLPNIPNLKAAILKELHDASYAG